MTAVVMFFYFDCWLFSAFVAFNFLPFNTAHNQKYFKYWPSVYLGRYILVNRNIYVDYIIETTTCDKHLCFLFYFYLFKKKTG